MSITLRCLGGAAAAAALFAATPVFAHATLEVGQAPANSTYKAVVRVPHGCGDQPTTAVHVVLPEGVIDVRPMPKAGWTLDTKRADYAKIYDLWGKDVSSGVTEVVWSGGELPSDYYDEFVFRSRITGFEDGTVLPIKVTQTCPDGEVACVEIAEPGQDPHDLDHPAPTLTVVAQENGGHGHHNHHGAATEETLSVEAVWMRQPPPGAKVAGGYMTISNQGDSADKLVGGTVPFAARLEVHEMAVKDGVMTMQQVPGGLTIPAGESVSLAPGGYHIMMMGLTEAPKAGEMVPITLEFEKAGAVELMMQVAPIGAAKAPEHDHSGHN